MVQSPTLVHDQRGAILIPALAMASVLMLGCIFIANTAQDMLGAMQVQTQSDAAALESAIWHAQGMNLLVTLNIVMACIMTVFLAIRLTVIILGVALVVAIAATAVAAFFTAGAGAAPGAQISATIGRAFRAMQKVEERVAKPVMNALQFTTNAEKVVAAAVPYVALALPVTRTSANPRSFPFSMSLLPNQLENDIKDWKFAKGKDGKRDQSPKINAGPFGPISPRPQNPGRMGAVSGFKTPDPTTTGRHTKTAVADRLAGKALKGKSGGKVKEWLGLMNSVTGSLPAQDDDLFAVCSRSGVLLSALFTKILLGPLNLDPASTDTINSVVGMVIGSFPTITCTPIDEVAGKAANKAASEMKNGCEAKKKQQETGKDADGNDILDEAGKPVGGKRWGAADDKKCKKELNDEVGKARGKDKDPKALAAKDKALSENIKTAALWGLATQPKDSPVLHVWNTTWSDDDGIESATAEAEFRHVCDVAKDKDGRSCSENSTWRYGWFAELVPYKNIGHELYVNLGEMAQGWASRGLGKLITGVLRQATRLIPQRVRTASQRPSYDRAANTLLSFGKGRHRAEGGGRHRRNEDAQDTVEVLIMRNLGLWRHRDVGNGWWNRKLAAPELAKAGASGVSWLGELVGLSGPQGKLEGFH